MASKLEELNRNIIGRSEGQTVRDVWVLKRATFAVGLLS